MKNIITVSLNIYVIIKIKLVTFSFPSRKFSTYFINIV